MGKLEKINEDFLYIMRKEQGVLGAWEFGSGMHGTRDEYSDIDMVFLLEEEGFDRIDRKIRKMLESVCDRVVIFWAEGFNCEAFKNYDCILEKDNALLQYDIFLLNKGHIEDFMCQLHYADLKSEDIIFDVKGDVAALLGKAPEGRVWQEDVRRLIETYWLHINMSVKYFLRKDYFKLDGVLRILMDTHTSLLLTEYDQITWGGTANKLHYIPAEKQAHLKKYYCHEDFAVTKQNLWQSMLWFEEDIQALEDAGIQEFHIKICEKIKKEWLKMNEIIH